MVLCIERSSIGNFELDRIFLIDIEKRLFYSRDGRHGPFTIR